MRASKSELPDQTRERYLGEIAPLLAAARKLDALSPVQTQQVRKRIVRTAFHARSWNPRVRLTPVLVGVGLLVAGGVAFATAERLGLIPRVAQDPTPLPAKASPEAHKRRASRLKGAKGQALPPGETSAAEPAIAMPEPPDPLLAAVPPASTSGSPSRKESPAAAVDSAKLVEQAQSVPARKSTGAAPIAPRPVTGLARRVGQPATNLALATPYLAEPVRAAGSSGGPAVTSTLSPPAPSAPSMLGPAPPLVRQDLAPASLAPASLAPPSLAPPSTAPSPPLAALPSAEPPKRVPRDPALFGQALRNLRNENNPTAALAALQEHAGAYPRSALAGERGVLEVEALLALHREREALQRLDGMSLSELPRSGERFVVRGELRAATRRWQEAKADFDHALARVSGSPAWHERALWGRGVAHLRCGEQELGMADIERYRDLYPKGRFAAEASRFFTNNR